MKQTDKGQTPKEEKTLSESAIQARREYYRRYNKMNSDKRRQWNNNHWEKVAAAQNAKERRED